MVQLWVVCASCLALSQSLLALPSFNLADFADDLEGWEPNDPWVRSDIDGIGSGNPYLKIEPNGIGGRGSRMITFNIDSEWTGDYVSAGVTGIRMDVTNRIGSDPLYLRIVIGNRANPQQTGGSWWISESAITITAGSDWSTYQLPLAESDMKRVGNLEGEVGTDSYAETLSDVKNIRILSAIIGQNPIGDLFLGEVGIDNIQFVPEPKQFALVLGILTGITSISRRSVHTRR